MMSGNHTLSGKKKVEGYKWIFVQSNRKFVKIRVCECKILERRTEILKDLRKLDSQTPLKPCTC